MKVNVISESAFTVQGHGVHTAFTETIDCLKGAGVDVAANTGRPADITHVHTVGPYSLYRLLLARGGRVVSAHVTPDSFVGSLVGAKLWYRPARAYLRWFYNIADAVIAVSAETARELAAMGVKAPVTVVPNTIDTAVFAPSPERRAAARRKLKLAADAFVVLGSGQVQPRKRIDSFVAVATALPEVRFVWAGGMPFGRLAADAGAMTEAMTHPPANVTFTGQLSRDEVIECYQAADAFLLPSDQETFGIVIVEAAATGLPVVLRDIAQYRETFTGDYLPAANDAAMAAVIARLAAEPAFYAEWQDHARHLAGRYDAESGARMLIKVYEEALRRRPHKAAV